MKITRTLPLLSLITFCLAVAPTPLPAEDAQTVTVTVPKADKVAIQIPVKWQQTVIQPNPELPPTVRITSPTGATSLQLTFLADPEGRFATKEGVEKTVTAVTQRLVAGSVEKRLTLVPLASESGHGSYASFTDADLVNVATPGAGQFKNVTSGLLVIKRQAAVFTLLSNGTDNAEYREAMKVITDGMSVP